jgi:hypothetical protein
MMVSDFGRPLVKVPAIGGTFFCLFDRIKVPVSALADGRGAASPSHKKEPQAMYALGVWELSQASSPGRQVGKGRGTPAQVGLITLT